MISVPFVITSTGSGESITPEDETSHQFASVKVTLYIPEGKFSAMVSVPQKGAQITVYGSSASLMLIVISPSVDPEQDVFVAIKFSIAGDGVS